MAELVWTTDKPTVPGWYWWRDETHAPSVIRVDDDLLIFLYEEYLTPDELGGEYGGPISEPREATP
jgi:hypothetical protein